MAGGEPAAFTSLDKITIIITISSLGLSEHKQKLRMANTGINVREPHL